MSQRVQRWMTTSRLAVGIAATAVALVATTATGLTAVGQAPADVAGDWALTVDVDGSVTTPSVMLEQNGAELTGHYSSETLGEADVTGTVTGNTVEFAFAADVQGYALDVTYTATVQDDGTLSGKMSVGGAADGTFTGKRR